MIHETQPSKEIFSYHLAQLPWLRVPGFFRALSSEGPIPGLRHSERLLTMNLGAPILSLSRYNLRSVALFAWWSEETFLDRFLEHPAQRCFQEGWQVRMKLYRRWGEIAEIKDAVVDASLAAPEKPVVAVTLARLNLSETGRFVRWGMPVERQVRDHPGQTLAMAAIRPPNTFSTFSVWKNEAEMLNLVNGRDLARDGKSHRLAINEMTRRNFHQEFTTLRFVPTQEVGARMMLAPQKT